MKYWLLVTIGIVWFTLMYASYSCSVSCPWFLVPSAIIVVRGASQVGVWTFFDPVCGLLSVERDFRLLLKRVT